MDNAIINKIFKEIQGNAFLSKDELEDKIRRIGRSTKLIKTRRD